MAPRFALPSLVKIFPNIFQCMHIDTLLHCTTPARPEDVSKKYLNRLLGLFKEINPMVTHQEKQNCLHFRRDMAGMTYRRALGIFVINSVGSLKSPIVHAKFR